jgi:hypothetical protein
VLNLFFAKNLDLEVTYDYLTATQNWCKPTIQILPDAKMMWFDPDDWYWKEITFSDDPTVTWVLDQKLDEKFCQRTQKRSIPPHDPCAAWAVFSCKQKDGQGEKHAMKIWMQYDRQSLYSQTR